MGDLQDLFKTKSFKLAAVLFVGYSVIVAVIGVFIFGFTDLGSATTRIEDRDANDAVVRTATEEKDSIPVMVVFTALASGGWLLIPLKFAWDQLAKESDSVRQELASQADDRRQTAEKMRELVFGAVRTQFGPMLYRQRAVSGWTERCLADRETGAALHARLLYTIAMLEDCYERMRQEGMPILLRSLRAESKASKCNIALMECIYGLCGTESDADVEILRAVRSGAHSGDRFVSFGVFRDRANGSDREWERFQKIHAVFVTACADQQKLRHLARCATKAHDSLSAGLNDVYRDWYYD